MVEKFKVKVQVPDFQLINYKELFYSGDIHLDQEISAYRKVCALNSEAESTQFEKAKMTVG